MTERIYCSETNRDEPLHGTADVVDVWLMLEYKPTWKAKALPQSDLTDAVKDWVQNSVDRLADAGLRARPQLVRQPELDRDDVRLLVGHAGQLWEFSGVGYDFLADIDLSSLANGGIPSGARPLEGPLYFVCTNGQRDLCCARFGLPVYTALRQQYGARVWQVTHLGGHRFAPNVLVMPQGLLYGRVSPDALDEFTTTVEAGGVAFSHLRGRSCYPKHVQAAEALLALPNLNLLHVDGDEQAATVTFAGKNSKHRIAIARAPEPIQVLASCGNEAPEPTYPYQAR